MWTVYVLQDIKGKLYKGLTNNLNRRINEHLRKKTRTTAKMDKVRVVYKENYDDFKIARKRELYFKTAAGRRFLKDKLWAYSSDG